ncbi:lytic transglycosylase [Citrobacter amalonaticus]|uniref:Lytic transglycosylase n=1 Tax=Citrobacter amalonaticus TaxID=35703 RepID=A0A2S4RY41_CITAM|nr:transglycosylase SLT domain-containing protein [Citrobacter amalonaticus]POT57849.1 lytic transglycosylase [Citrobacter amalonaticus]POT76624.1 lytic transglycosylase [Citrobacter amalonaticus]POU65703.1 lytic transglycosylase [Citrobacter amalonaticus]POV05860.1 lytic transglycosylase [Citrobacter amalonaticus]
MKKMALFSLLLFAVCSHSADCFDRAGYRYKIHPDLLRAIAFKESSFRQSAINFVSPEKYAIGTMQIHSQNFQHLRRFGITPGRLYRDRCLNIYTGAYYLALAFRRWGYSWRAVGAYNAGFLNTPEQELKRSRYANDVRRIYEDIKKRRTAKNK